jgi:hypothetical protein
VPVSHYLLHCFLSQEKKKKKKQRILHSLSLCLVSEIPREEKKGKEKKPGEKRSYNHINDIDLSNFLSSRVLFCVCVYIYISVNGQKLKLFGNK